MLNVTMPTRLDYHMKYGRSLSEGTDKQLVKEWEEDCLYDLLETEGVRKKLFYALPKQERALVKLEKLIGEKIPIVSNLEEVTCGLTKEGSKIVGLKLQNKGFEYFPCVVNGFLYLRTLDLSGNPMKKKIPIPDLRDSDLKADQINSLVGWPTLIPIKCVDLERLVLKDTSFEKDMLYVFNNRFLTIVDDLDVYPREIQKQYDKKLISKKKCCELLTHIVKNSKSSYYIVKSIEVIKELKFCDDSVIRVLEKYAFGENPLVRAASLEALFSLLQEDKMDLYLRAIQESNFGFLNDVDYMVVKKLLDVANKLNREAYVVLRKKLHEKMAEYIPYEPKELLWIWDRFCFYRNNPHAFDENRRSSQSASRELSKLLEVRLSRGRIKF